MVSPASPGNGTYYTGPGPGQADGRPPQKEKKLPPIGNSYTMLVPSNSPSSAGPFPQTLIWM